MSEIYFWILCVLAVSHGCYLGVVLLSFSRNRGNVLVSALVVALALRLSKSLFSYLGAELPVVFIANYIGLIAMSLVGPLFYFSIQVWINSLQKIGLRQVPHLIPTVAILFVIPFLNWNVINIGYYLFTALCIVYYMFSLSSMRVKAEMLKTDEPRWRFLILMAGGVGILMLTFILQITIYQPLFYSLNIAFAVMFFYGFSWWLYRNTKLFIMSRKSPSHENFETVIHAVDRLFADDIFLDPTLTVSKVASQIKVPAYLVSRAVNKHYQKTFSELLLDYRIKRAEKLLISEKIQSYTVEAIAYESGFNTPSSFYASFKKKHGVTPIKYKEVWRNQRSDRSPAVQK